MINYTIENAVKKYPEVADFYWQIVGPDWDVAHQNVEVTVKLLPRQVSDISQILVWGHGPLNGKSEIIDGQTVKFSAAKVASGQFMEIRTLFPAELISGAIDGQLTSQQIKDEESKFVKETIAAVKREQLIARLLMFSPLLFLLAGSIWFIWWYGLWKKYGKEYLPVDVPQYLRDLPTDLGPAEVDCLLRQGGEPTVNAFTATLFDLARKGFLEIKDTVIPKSGWLRTKQIYKTTISLKTLVPIGNLKNYELDLLNFIFSDIGKAPAKFANYLFKKRRSWRRQNRYPGDCGCNPVLPQAVPDSIPVVVQRLEKNVKAEMEKHQILENQGTRLSLKATISAIIFGLTGIPLTGGMSLIWMIIAIVLSQNLKRWTAFWAKEVAEWRAFKHFLKDFAGHKFKTIPPEAYKLWEHYLVFGILFGLADKIINLLPVILANLQAVSSSWYQVAGLHTDDSSTSVTALSSLISSLSVMTSQMSAASTSAARYSAGGGGGFAGGGGGAG